MMLFGAVDAPAAAARRRQFHVGRLPHV